MFSLVCYGYLTLFEYMLRIKVKNENVRSISIFSWTVQLLRGMEELFMLLVMAFFKVTHQKAYLSVNKVRKILILTTGIFSVKAQQIFQFFLNRII